MLTVMLYSYFQDGKPDMSYFAPDCFHIREKGHEALAEALWNNMVGLWIALASVYVKGLGDGVKM